MMQRPRSRSLTAITAGLVGAATIALAPSPASAAKARTSSTPTVSIASPAAGTTSHGAIVVSGSAAGSKALVSLQVSIDGGGWVGASGTASWTLTLSTPSYRDGSHTISARVTDSAGSVGTASESVFFSNAAPVVTINTPQGGASVGGSIVVSGTASSASGLASVQVQLDDGPLQAASGTSSWTATLATAGVANGPHSVTAWVTDTSGRTAVRGVQVTVANTLACSTSGGPGSLSGVMFQDPNRDGVYQPGEAPMSGQTLYLFDGSGANVDAVTTGSNGGYSFTGLAPGSYRLELSASSWWAIRDTMAPDTTGSAAPTVDLCVGATTTYNFGWRPIVTSTVAGSPLSVFTGPNGLRVETYADVVTPRALFDDLMTGGLIGPEAAYETIRFGLDAGTTTATSCTQVNGVYTSCSSISSIGLDNWLDEGDYPIFFEYGNHWNMYYTYLDHQGSWNDYYVARGVAGNPMLGSSQAWSHEMLTDDWRQLFGSPTAQAVAPLNGSIPPASQVPNLAQYLSTTYRGM